MSVGMILLTVVALLVFFGAAQRVLDKMRMSDRMALLLVALMFVGTLIPNIPLGLVSVSVGGALIPLGGCVYLLVKAESNKERLRALLGAVLTGGVIYALSAFLLPDEPEEISIDPLYLYGIVGGLIAYLLGRSRRGAFICGVLGVMLSDIANAVVVWSRGAQQTLVLGGGGVFDAMVFAGVLGVLLCELLGELLERIARGRTRPEHARIVNPVRQKDGGEA